MFPRVALCCAAIVLGAAACSAPAANGPATSTTASRPGSLDGVDPCSVLDQQGQTELGVAGGSHNGVNSSAASSCGWLLGDGYYATIGFFPTVGLGDLALPTSATATSVNGRPGKKVMNGTAGDCSVYLAATAHSSIQIEVDQGQDSATACYDALKVAFVADQKLSPAA
jgi:Protein of unknown function (DUF3558)